MSIYFQRTYQRAFGTYPLRGETCTQAVATALASGYRAFDTAQMYGNESEVGEALAHGGVPHAARVLRAGPLAHCVGGESSIRHARVVPHRARRRQPARRRNTSRSELDAEAS